MTTTLPRHSDWITAPWSNDKMHPDTWMELFAQAERDGNLILANSLLHIAFGPPYNTCSHKVATQVFLMAGEEPIREHKKNCLTCSRYFAKAADGRPCPTTQLAEKARHTIVQGLMRRHTYHGHEGWHAIDALRKAGVDIGDLLMHYLIDQYNWIDLEPQGLSISKSFLASMAKSDSVYGPLLHMHDDLERRKLFFRALCLYGEIDNIDSVTTQPDPVSANLLVEIALGRTKVLAGSDNIHGLGRAKKESLLTNVFHDNLASIEERNAAKKAIYMLMFIATAP